MNKIRTAWACMAAAPLWLLAGCAPTVVGGVAIGAPSNIDERNVADQLVDQSIETTIDQRLKARFTGDERVRWKVASFDRRAVLVGVAPDEATREEMDRLARGVEQTGTLDNEVRVGPLPRGETRATDLAVAANLRRRLMNDPGARFNAMKVLVDNGVAHLVGRVTDQESRIAEFIARNTDGVQRVVTHWTIRP